MSEDSIFKIVIISMLIVVFLFGYILGRMIK